jgi:hypothetical protein
MPETRKAAEKRKQAALGMSVTDQVVTYPPKAQQTAQRRIQQSKGAGSSGSGNRRSPRMQARGVQEAEDVEEQVGAMCILGYFCLDLQCICM